LTLLAVIAWHYEANAAQLHLTWTDNSNNEDGFKIERKKGASGTFKQIAVLGANVSSYTDKGLASGTTYCYRVRAFKRVIGLEGDLLEIRKKKVYINGQLVKDPHAHFEDGEILLGPFRSRDNYGPETVPENNVFVLGDNRDRSHDSRFWGFLDIRDVKGKAFIIYWSWDGTDRWVRWERIGVEIQ